VPTYHDQRRWGARWLLLGEVDTRGSHVVMRQRADAEGALEAEWLRVSAVPQAR
jgi:hypothetical protein